MADVCRGHRLNHTACIKIWQLNHHIGGTHTGISDKPLQYNNSIINTLPMYKTNSIHTKNSQA